MEEDACCWAIGNGDDGRVRVSNPELGAVSSAAMVWIGVCLMIRSNRSTIVDGEDGVLGDSPAGAKV